MDEKNYDALEEALADLAAGNELDSVIAANPALDAEITTGVEVQSLSPVTIPPDAIHRSRTRMLTRAMELRQEAQPRWGFIRRMPRMVYALVLAIIFLLSWNGLVFASAQALPGDQLYPAKLTLEKLRLGLALNPQTHQKVELQYHARRIDEVQRLLSLGRVELIQFLGIVEQQRDDHWIIGGIEVRLFPETIILGDIIPGMMVEVEGATQPEDWVKAAEIHLQNFSFTGTVEEISTITWIISGQEVLVISASLIDTDIQVGDTVIAEVNSDDFGTLTAKRIIRLNTEDNKLRATETPKPPIEVEDTPETEDENENDEIEIKDDSKEESENPEPDEADETNEPKETDEPDNADEPDESDKLKETDEPDDADEPDESDKPKETDKPDDTDEPEKTDKPKETDEPDDTDEPEKTDKPKETDEPDDTDEPDKTDEPED